MNATVSTELLATAADDVQQLLRECALYEALALAQGEFEAIAKNRSAEIKSRDPAKQSYTFRYADLESILAATRPALAKNGLALVQLLREDEHGRYIDTILAHKAGGKLESRLSLPREREGGDIKQVGAAISYLRRYAVQSLLCVSADDDADQDPEGGGNMPPPQARRSEPKQPPRRQRETPAAPAQQPPLGFEEPRDQAPPPATSQAAPLEPRADDNEPATEGERARIAGLFRDAQPQALATALREVGADVGDNLAGLTKGQFRALRRRMTAA